MKIILTAGGSGGHITPLLAVAAELKRQQPDVELIYIGQKGDKLADIPAKDPHIDAVYTVRAGKFRRYHGEGFKQLLDVKTVFLNARDAIYVVIGLAQSYFLLRKLRPAAIFTRGGFVSVPVALAGRLHSIPYMTHDSDSTPSLANRLIARWAWMHAVALPAEIYPYPIDKTVTVGVPVSTQFQPVTAAMMQNARKQLHLEAAKQIVLVTGGGNGAQRLNQAVIDNADYLLKRYKGLYLVHVAGRDHEAAVNAAYDKHLVPGVRERVLVRGFVEDMYAYSAAADIVIARGGATNLAEFAIQGKACIIVPSSQLIWNVKNTQALAERGTILQLTDEQAEQERRLASLIVELLDDDQKRLSLASELGKLGHPHAARELAELILKEAGQ